MTNSPPAGSLIIALAADHRGFLLKERLTAVLIERAITVRDFGATEFAEADDYPDFGIPAAKFVAEDPDQRHGLFICGSGQGMAIVANKVPGIRAIVVSRLDQLTMDEAPNVLALAADHLDATTADTIVAEWLAGLEQPMPARHQRRIAKIEALDHH